MASVVLHMTRTIDASHVIDGHPGKCGRLHGHTYRFEVWLKGPVQDDGMLVDFYDVKSLIDAWDHRHLNDIVDGPTTAENLALIMYERLTALLRERCSDDADIDCFLRLWETADGCAQVGNPTIA